MFFSRDGEFVENPIYELIKIILDYKKEILLIGGLVGGVVGAYLGYTYYANAYEEQAYRALVEALEYYDAPIKTSDKKSDEPMDFTDKKEFAIEA